MLMSIAESLWYWLLDVSIFRQMLFLYRVFQRDEMVTPWSKKRYKVPLHEALI